MITRAFVEPAYKCIKLMDITNTIPLSLNLQTGKFRLKNRLAGRIIHWLFFGASVLKTLHHFSTVLHLIAEFKPESLPKLILTILMLSLLGTSVFWGWELFHRRVDLTIVLFNSLEYAPTSVPLKLENGADAARKRQKQVGSVFHRLAFVVTSKASTLASLTASEFLIVCTPFAVKLFVPLYMLTMIVFPYWDTFITSFVYLNGERSWTWKMGLCFALELTQAFYAESNILFFFFFNLALQVTHIAHVEMDVAGLK